MPTPRLLFVLFLALPLVLTSCDSSDPEPTTGTITGNIALPAAASGDIERTRVTLYESLDEFRNDVETFSATADEDGNYMFENINPGSYFLAAFKDNDNSGDLSSGDFYGYLGGGPLDPSQATPQRQQVTAGDNLNIDFVIQIVPPGFGISLTGTYSGTSQGLTLTMNLTDTNGNITGSGTLNTGAEVLAINVTGSRNGTSVTLQISGETVPLTFTGTLSDDASTLTGTVTGTGNDGSPISIPFTLNLQ